MRVTEFFSVAFCSSVLDLLPCSLCSLKDILSSHFTTSRSEPAPVNHGDAAPIIVDGIIPASFLPHGAHLLKKKMAASSSSAFFASAPSSTIVVASVLGYHRALSPGLYGRCRSLQLLDFRAAPSSAFVVPSRPNFLAINALRD
jgi:hypothetical protein